MREEITESEWAVCTEKSGVGVGPWETYERMEGEADEGRLT